MTIVELIRSNASKLTESDQKLISALLGNKAASAYLSGPELASLASVHEATATRLAQKLGFSGFPGLREQLRREVLDEQDAANRMRRSVSKVAQGDYLTDLVSSEIAALEGLSRAVSQEQIDTVADAIFEAKRVFLFGEGHAQAITTFLHRRLDRFGMTTIALMGRGRDIAERLVGLGQGDVVLALAFRKQPESYAPLIRHAGRVGATTILISDLSGESMEPRPDLMLTAPRGRSRTEFQTPTVPLAIVNAILITIAGRHEQPVIGALERLSELFADFE